MTRERDLLRDVRAALDVLPSNDFEARVRERVRTQAMRTARWTWTAGMAAAATIVVAVMLVPQRQGVTSRQRATVVTTAADRVRPTQRSVRPATEPDGGRRSTRRRFDRAGLPPAVIPEGQARAIQRLMAEVAAGRVAMGPARPGLPEVLEVAALGTAAPIAFDPIRFKSLSAEESPDLWR